MKLLKTFILAFFLFSGCMPRCAKYDKQGCEEASRKEYEEARQHFELAIEANNNYWSAYSNLGALSDYRTALKYFHNDKFIYAHLGTLYSDLDSCNQAMKYLELAIKNSAFDECTSKNQLEYLLKKCNK